MKDRDRLDMIKKLAYKDQLDILESYIPNHYPEIYTLYSILQDASIDYKNIDFYEPIEEDNSFIFLCNFDNNDVQILESFLEKNDYKFKYLRKSPEYMVALAIDDTHTRIKFRTAN